MTKNKSDSPCKKNIVPGHQNPSAVMLQDLHGNPVNASAYFGFGDQPGFTKTIIAKGGGINATTFRSPI